jgi:hypothetical protein
MIDRAQKYGATVYTRLKLREPVNIPVAGIHNNQGMGNSKGYIATSTYVSLLEY